MSTLKVTAISHPTSGSLATINGTAPSNRRININGAMTVAQRGTAHTLSSSSAVQAVDRMFCRINGAGSFTIEQSTEAPAGFANSLKWDCTNADSSLAAGDFAYIAYRMEGQDVQHLQKGTSNALALTASFWVRSNKTGDYAFRLSDVDNTRQIGGTYTINTADTWEKKVFTFDGDTSGVLDNDNNLSLQMLWWIASGSDRTTGSVPTAWEASVTADEAAGHTVNLADSYLNEFYITGVQLEVGEVATPFEHRSYGDEYQQCQRYYYQPPTEENIHACLYNSSANTYLCEVWLPTTMRAAPTVTVSGGESATVTITGQAPHKFAFYRNATATTYVTGFTASAEL